MAYRSHIRLLLAVLLGVFLLGLMFAVTLPALTTAKPVARGTILLTVFALTFVAILIFVMLLQRWLLKPYRQLVGEAERAPVPVLPSKARNEAEFVLETFQSVVAQLQAHQHELEALSAQARARADSAEKFNERIVASVPSGLIAFDAQGRATVVNAPAHNLVEANGEAQGQHARSLLRHAPELAGMIETCLSTGKVYKREEVAATSNEGRVRRLGVTIAPIDLASEQGARGALCLLIDLTEVSELREQVALKRNLESLGEMSAGLAHEFKNALATLHGYAQLLQNLELDERGHVAASSILQEVRNLSQMVTAFLNFARPQPLDFTTISLDELMGECATELHDFYQEHRVSLDISADQIKVRADEPMLRQALLNLLRNAAEAMDEEKALRRVFINITRQKDADGESWANVEIKDTGAGIPARDLQRIFIPFFTTKSKGHGIGLALTHRVITDHGGALSAANAIDGGAIFTIKLPLDSQANRM